MPNVNTSIAQANAALAPIVSPGSPAAALEQCLAQLTNALLQISNTGITGVTDSKSEGILQNILQSPFDSVKQAIQNLFSPPPGATPASVSDYVGQYTNNLSASLRDPVSAILGSQQQIFTDSWQQISTILYGSGTPGAANSTQGILTPAIDQLHMAMQSLFTGNGPNAGSGNLLAILFYAVQEGIPAVDAEIQYLVQMKQQIQVIREQTTQLPSLYLPQIPLFCLSSELCLAQQYLDDVIVGLESDTFNRTAWAQATDAVCASTTIISAQQIPPTLRAAVKSYFGLSDLQVNSLTQLLPIPNVQYQIALNRLQTLNGYVQSIDPSVTQLDNNLRTAIATIEQLDQLNLSQVLVLVVQVLQAQITGLRANLEASSAGLSVTAVKNGGTQTWTQTAGKAGPNNALSFLTTQGTTYIILVALCYVMNKVGALISAINTALSVENAFFRAFQGIITNYMDGACVNAGGVLAIDSAVQTFVANSNLRITGQRLSSFGTQSDAATLVAAIDDQITYLQCLRGNFTQIENSLSAITGINLQAALQLVATIGALDADVKFALSTFNMGTILGLEYGSNAADALMAALQCLVLQCPNNYLQSLQAQAQQLVGVQGQQKKTQQISMPSFDATPARAQSLALNQKIQAITALLTAVEGLTQLDLSQLCMSPTPATVVGTATTQQPVAPSSASIQSSPGELSISAATIVSPTPVPFAQSQTNIPALTEQPQVVP